MRGHLNEQQIRGSKRQHEPACRIFGKWQLQTHVTFHEIAFPNHIYSWHFCSFPVSNHSSLDQTSSQESRTASVTPAQFSPDKQQVVTASLQWTGSAQVRNAVR